ncbi:MAG TPA: PH domain-containing protein [Gaiellaceae bacterium]|nr:PH domain-containing protein [Gaiellaceae bacterium]
MTTGQRDWQRLHPLSPVVRGGRLTIAIGILLLPAVARGGQVSDAVPQLIVAAILLAAGFVSWLVTRWRIDGDDLQIETGLLRRQSLRFPLAQVQAIDVVRPGLARMFRVAELRLRMAGASGATARLAYLPERDVEPLRDRLLALARGASAGRPELEEAAEQPEQAAEQLVAQVATWRLAVSILISDVGLTAELILVGLVIAAVTAPHAAAAIGGGSVVWVVTALTLVWRRFNQLYRQRVAQGPEGLHVHGGLVALTTEVIRPGRVQAVRMVEPFLWRPLGWCRLEVDLAGRQRSKGEGEAERGQMRTLLPVGGRALALELVDRLVPDRPRELSPPPRRAFWKSPLRYRKLAWGRSGTVVATTSGRLRRVSSWVPLEKVQSLRHVEGPIQRRLRLASVHVDTAGRAVHATLRDRDASEAEQALADLAELARAARRAPAAA